MKRSNFPGRKAARQQSATERQEAYDKLSHDEKVDRARTSGGVKVLNKLTNKED